MTGRHGWSVAKSCECWSVFSRPALWFPSGRDCWPTLISSCCCCCCSSDDGYGGEDGQCWRRSCVWRRCAGSAWSPRRRWSGSSGCPPAPTPPTRHPVINPTLARYNKIWRKSNWIWIWGHPLISASAIAPKKRKYVYYYGPSGLPYIKGCWPAPHLCITIAAGPYQSTRVTPNTLTSIFTLKLPRL